MPMDLDGLFTGSNNLQVWIEQQIAALTGTGSTGAGTGMPGGTGSAD